MLERRKPLVTELALADALDQLVNLIEELRADADLRVELTTDETSLVKLVFSGTPDVGFAMRREVRDVPGEVIRRIWNEGLRDYDTAQGHNTRRPGARQRRSFNVVSVGSPPISRLLRVSSDVMTVTATSERPMWPVHPIRGVKS